MEKVVMGERFRDGVESGSEIGEGKSLGRD